MKKILFVAFLFGITLSSCEDDKVVPTPVVAKGNLNVNFTHTFNGQPFQLDTSLVNSLNDTIKFSNLLYYISNVSLQNSSGTWVNLGNYNLVDFKFESSKKLVIPNLPAGNYTKLKFFVGVDKVANSTGAQEGDLNPSNGMFWSWATGYIFIRLQGKFNGDKPLTVDMGGDDNLVTIEFPIDATVAAEGSATAIINFNVADVFVTPNNYKLDDVNSVMHSADHPSAQMLKENITTGAFSLTSFN
ncbi:MAG: DUF4382 domain-containing protein [Bacteroidia bacterium]|nr:DUF4382 domain-containing protein [Bacteroidia bacterium]MBP9689549.1 DUF4382 domain-containing protein [Bacteroidia bacterium]